MAQPVFFSAATIARIIPTHSDFRNAVCWNLMFSADSSFVYQRDRQLFESWDCMGIKALPAVTQPAQVLRIGGSVESLFKAVA